jgi:hypothetical protein
MLDESARLTDQALNVAIATAMGYEFAGPFRGRVMYHPPMQRTSVVECPDYTHDWNALMPLVLGCWGRWSKDIRDMLFAMEPQRLLAEAVLLDLWRSQGRVIDAPRA